jgi:hypothetical protein
MRHSLKKSMSAGKASEKLPTVNYGRRLPEDPLDAELRRIGVEATPEQRLDAILSAYEYDQEVHVSRPPSGSQRLAVHDWFRALRVRGRYVSLSARLPARRNLYFEDVANQASLLQQAPCQACEWQYPSYDLPIQVLPWSAQAQKKGRNRRIKDAVHAELLLRNPDPDPSDSAFCVTVISLVSSAEPKKDVDNLVKGLLDAMTGIYWRDDRQIQCLTTRRVEYAAAEGLYFVAIRPARAWSETVLFDTGNYPDVRSGSVIRVD